MPRAGLTRERIAQQAAAAADETGFDRLTRRPSPRAAGYHCPACTSTWTAWTRSGGTSPAGRPRAHRRPGPGGGGPGGRDALVAFSQAYRGYATAHPGRYAASVRAPDAGDEEHNAACAAAVGLIANVLKGYRIEGDDMIDAVRMLRAALHGFVALEAAGGFGLPQSVDGTSPGWSTPCISPGPPAHGNGTRLARPAVPDATMDSVYEVVYRVLLRHLPAEAAHRAGFWLTARRGRCPP